MHRPSVLHGRPRPRNASLFAQFTVQEKLSMNGSANALAHDRNPSYETAPV